MIFNEVTNKLFKLLLNGTTPVGNSKKLNGLTAEEFVSNENLLINSYFLDPVNSSGKTEWTSTGDTIDKWKMANTNGTVALTENGLTITKKDGSYFQFHYNLYDYKALLGKTITISAKVNDTVYSKTLTLPTTDSSIIDTSELALPYGYIDFYKQTNQSNLQLRYIMSATAGSSVTFEWIKLELGSVATPMTPPNKEVEKLKCGAVEADVTMLPPTLSTSILEKALELPTGIYNYNLNGSSYTGGDLPNTNYAFGQATIRKRNTSAIEVILWGAQSVPEPMVNYYNANTATFDDWERFNDGGNADTVDGYHASDILKSKQYCYYAGNSADCNELTSFLTLGKGTNYPDTANFYYVFTINYVDEQYKQIAFRYAGSAMYERTYYNGWGEWKRLSTTADLANYLPLDGSVPMSGMSLRLNGGKSMVRSDDNAVSLYTFPTKSATNEYDTVGATGIVAYSTDYAEAANMPMEERIKCRIDNVTYTMLHSGNVGKHALPISGGSIKDSVVTPLNVNSTASDARAYISLSKSGVIQGYLGFKGANTPVFGEAGTGNAYPLHHDGNSAKVVVSETPLTAEGSIRVW